METDEFGHKLYAATADADRQVVARVAEVAAARGVPMAQVALAWILSRKGVTAPIIGASKPEQLRDALAALGLKLTPDEVTAMEAPYVPHAEAG